MIDWLTGGKDYWFYNWDEIISQLLSSIPPLSSLTALYPWYSFRPSPFQSISPFLLPCLSQCTIPLSNPSLCLSPLVIPNWFVLPSTRLKPPVVRPTNGTLLHRRQSQTPVITSYNLEPPHYPKPIMKAHLSVVTRHNALLCWCAMHLFSPRITLPLLEPWKSSPQNCIQIDTLQNKSLWFRKLKTWTSKKGRHSSIILYDNFLKKKLKSEVHPDLHKQ